jgi:hypothetical protein
MGDVRNLYEFPEYGSMPEEGSSTDVYFPDGEEEEPYIDFENGCHPSLAHPTPDMLESRLATERVDGIDTTLDAVARLGLVTGTELNEVYLSAVQHIIATNVCPDQTLCMLQIDIMKFPMYKPLDPIKRAAVLFALYMFPEMQHEFAIGNTGGKVHHEPIDQETMDLFIRGGLKESMNSLLSCIETPHQFVDSVMKKVEDGGVYGYVQRSSLC